MISPDLESKLAEKYERATQGYWFGSLDLADARKKAVHVLVDNEEEIPPPVVPFRA